MRLRGPTGAVLGFVAVAGLVAGGLAWVTVAALRVETAQREAAAQTDQANNLRVALWRLDGSVLLPLALEDGRPFDHYAPVVSPLPSAPLPDWMRLHFQLDPRAGWESPQVPAIGPSSNLTSDRATLLADLRGRFPPRDVAAVLTAREPTVPSDVAPFAVSAVLPSATPDPDPPPTQADPAPPGGRVFGLQLPSLSGTATGNGPPFLTAPRPEAAAAQQTVAIPQQQALALNNLNTTNYRINTRAAQTQNGEFVNRAQIVSRGLNESKGAYDNGGNGGNAFYNLGGLNAGNTLLLPNGGPVVMATTGLPPTAGPTSIVANGTLTPSSTAAAPPPAPIAVHLGAMRPHWLRADDGAERLVLVRSARLPDRVVYQGVVLDWDRLQTVLKDVVHDLFPDAKLLPVRDPTGLMPERAMTALPVQLDPGPPADPPPAGWTPLRFGLALAWAAALTALLAAGLGGWSLVDLSERRIRFVSAVTHELRTPLTSLRLYLDLLTSGMIADEGKRAEYLGTLHSEADRLHRLIDNVLDFARLENRPRPAARRPIAVAALLDRVRETWLDRCAASGRELLTVSTLPPGCDVPTDPDLFGQVVGNLIDNARKYAKEAADGRIWVWAKPARRGRIVFEVEDRGPGVPPRERGRVFRPFRRGADADTTAGGAGLGLALARRWAAALGGRLSYRPADGGVGACFRLELPG